MSTLQMKAFALLLLLFNAAVVLAAARPAPAAPTSGGKAGEFIRARCGVTLYPDLCISALSRYAGKVGGDPVLLARAATIVSLARLRSVSAHVAAIPARGDAQAAAALKDCASSLGDAADDAKLSAAELGRLVAAEGAQIGWRVSNALTWMSAAMTNEVTCEDGFNGVGEGRVKADVLRQIRQAKEFTSNALALVNHLVAGRR